MDDVLLGRAAALYAELVVRLRSHAPHRARRFARTADPATTRTARALHRVRRGRPAVRGPAARDRERARRRWDGGRRRGLARPAPALALAVAPATDRFGWFVDRRAFGTDLHDAWGGTMLELEEGGSVRAGEHLRRAWACAREQLAGWLSATELRYADGAIHGDVGPPMPSASCPPTSPLGALLEPRTRPGFRIEARIATWDFTVFRLIGNGRSAFACIPRSALRSRFLDAAAAGELDAAIHAYLRAATGGVPLMTAESDHDARPVRRGGLAVGAAHPRARARVHRRRPSARKAPSRTRPS